MTYELNTPVVFLRGGIDSHPQVNLRGVPGRICSPWLGAEPGMVGVWIEWEKTPYANLEGLPMAINTYPNDITLA